MNKKEKSEFELESKNKWRKVLENGEEKIKVEEDISQEIEPHREGIEFSSREKLESQLNSLERKLDEYKNQYLRSQAEIDNLRKRTERDIVNAIKYGAEQLITDLFPIVDSLIHGIESPESTDLHAKSLREGMSLTLDLLHKTLEKHGIEIIDPKLGDPFNPAFHEAVAIQNVPDAKSDTIVQLMQKGYKLNGRVLRAARVIVAAAA
ncbi:MAG: nucleotide exchange factor GrpE [Coxiella endosymbiont of Haemaphysalis qinghaiensis]